ncbi:ROK family transcriptional regulator [Actinopolymorpha sp. B9G3]|uniref:ROK family transcriptional regulator n=1 Tax=Actinopolymorpha sp. B9G3 TaxID=3158970 RepID=UPI0032D962D7
MSRAESATPPLLRRLNAGRVLDVLRSGGPLNVAELAAEAGLSRVTLDAVVEDLIGLGLVAEVPKSATDGARGRGRPPRRLRFRAESGYLLGVDIGAHRLEVVVTDLLGAVVGGRERSVDPAMSRPQRLRAARRIAASAMDDARVSPSDLRAIGVGTPGIVDSQTGTVTYCNAMAGWSGLCLAAEFGRGFDCAVAVENDANLATLGECWQGAAHGVDDVVLLLAGDRIGAGIVIGGELVRGKRGGTGEMTFLGLLRDTDSSESIEELLRAVVRTEVDQLISRRQVQGEPVRTLLRGLAPLHGVQVDDLDRTLAAAQRRQRAAVRQVETAMERTCAVAIVITTLVSPELFVIGGNASASGDIILPAIRAALDGVSGPGVEPPQVAVSTLGERAVALGAIRKALDLAVPHLLDAQG